MLPIYEVIAQINEISQLLNCFNGLQTDFPRVLAAVAKVVPMDLVLVIEASSGPAKATVWCAPDVSQTTLEEAKRHAQDAFVHLTRLDPGAIDKLQFDQTSKPLPVAVSRPAEGRSLAAARRLLLPLVVDHRPIFGIIQIDCATPAGETALAFINALANQLAIVLDRIGLQKREREMALRQQAAEAANLAKSRFLANMSHEIRTPLGAILGFTELLLEPDINPADRDHYAATIRRNGGLLASLIDDILDLSKVEAGKIDIESVPVSLPGLLADVQAMMLPLAREKSIAFDMQCCVPLPEVIRTDPTRLKQILINILGNAIKFTEAGSVNVRIDTAANASDAHSKRRFIALVTDTGRGISQEAAERLFQPFEQADNTTTRKFGGTGLGLVLSRRLARAMGGDVELSASEPGKGSTFRIEVVYELEPRLPLHWQEPSQNDRGLSKPLLPAQVHQPILSGKRVLLVEDTTDNQILFNSILKANGAVVDTVSNGLDGINQAFKHDYDLVLMDLQMPRCDGFAATAELRRRGFRKPILALSAYAMKEDRERAMLAGCSDYLAKPITKQKLISKVTDLTSEQLH